MYIVYFQPCNRIHELLVDSIDKPVNCWIWNELHDFYMKVSEESVLKAYQHMINFEKLNHEFMISYLREGQHPESLKQFVLDKKILPPSDMNNIEMLSELSK